MIGLNFLKSNLYNANFVKLKLSLEKLSKNNIYSFLFGIFATMILQSSSALTAIIIAFLGANLIDLKPAILIILASNIGTCLTPFIFALNIKYITFILFFIGYILILLKKNKLALIGNIIIDVGFIFLGLRITNYSISCFSENGFFDIFFYNKQNNFLSFFLSILLTMITQSSSLVIVITQTLYQNDVFNLYQSLIFVLGSNIGTCIATYLYTFSFPSKVKIAIKVNIIFNILSAFIFILLLKYFCHITLFIKNLLLLNKPATIALFQLIFNFVPTIIIFMFYNKIYFLISNYFIKD